MMSHNAVEVAAPCPRQRYVQPLGLAQKPDLFAGPDAREDDHVLLQPQFGHKQQSPSLDKDSAMHDNQPEASSSAV